MKNLVLALACVLSFSALAATDVGVISTTTDSVVTPSDRSNFMEAGMQYSSMNEGTPFATVALVHEWKNGFALGARGLLPMAFAKQAQSYMGQIMMRFILLNEGDQVFVEPTISQGYFNGVEEGRLFATVGMNVGYTHNIKKLWSVGGMLGVDYSPSRISRDEITNRSTLYNKVAVTGSYYF